MNAIMHAQPQNRNATSVAKRAGWGRGRGWPGAVPALLVAASLLFAPALAPADDIPSAINYQGKLTDSLGHPLTNGLYTIDFRIWDDQSVTNAADYIWGRQFPVYVGSNGMFNVLLSDAGGLLTSPNSTGKVSSLVYAFDQSSRYLGLSIRQVPGGTLLASAPEISPRQQFASAPFAMHAQQASSAATAVVASNAMKFGPYATNDFLMASKPNQTLTGSLTISNGNLTLKSNLIVNVNGTVSGDLTVDGKVTAGGDLNVSGKVTGSALNASGKVTVGSDLTVYGNASVSGTMDVNAGIRCGSTNPIVIQQFTPPPIPKDYPGSLKYETTFRTNEWTAAIAGFTFDADVMETGKKSPYLRLRMIPYYSTTKFAWFWAIEYFLAPEQQVELAVDVMFIRRELARDMRP